MKKTTLRNLGKDIRGLSPVVASIILIAVTVAVSVAVAAWMGGMTIGFMGTSSVTVTNVAFDDNAGVGPNTIIMDLKNTGTKTASIVTIKINNQPVDMVNDVEVYLDPGNTTLTMNAGLSMSIQIGGSLAAWVNGNTYKIDMFDGSNQVIGSTQQNAPGA